MLEQKDLQNVKMGYDGSITILEGINTKVQMFYCLYFGATIIKKDETFYYIKETSCKDGYVVTEFPYKHITLELLEEMEKEAVNNYVKGRGMGIKNPIENLLDSNNAKVETIYFDR